MNEQLNTKAITDRILKDSLVVGYTREDEVKFGILIPNGWEAKGSYFELVEGSVWPQLSEYDWIIRSGDKVMVSNNGREWPKRQYDRINNGIFTGSPHPYQTDDGCVWKFMRPIAPDSPDKTRLLAAIKEAEKSHAATGEHLANLKKRAEEMK